MDLKNSVKEEGSVAYKRLLCRPSVVDVIYGNFQWGVSNTGSPPYLALQTDVSSEGGGCFYNGDHFYINWALDLPVCATEHINVEEFVAIFLAVFRWCHNFWNKKVIVYSDDPSAVSWINKGTSRNPLIQFMCRILCTIVLSVLVTFQVNKSVLQMHVPAFMSLDNLLNFIH